MNLKSPLLLVAFVVFTLPSLLAGSKAIEKWVITQASMSKICTVQKETSRPLLGKVIGTYDSKEAAQKARAEMQKNGDCQ